MDPLEHGPQTRSMTNGGHHGLEAFVTKDLSTCLSLGRCQHSQHKAVLQRKSVFWTGWAPCVLSAGTVGVVHANLSRSPCLKKAPENLPCSARLSEEASMEEFVYGIASRLHFWRPELLLRTEI